jgi:hypothetical protein
MMIDALSNLKIILSQLHRLNRLVDRDWVRTRANQDYQTFPFGKTVFDACLKV